MKQQLAIAFLVAIISSTYANPHLVRRQAAPDTAAPPAGDAAPTAEAGAAPTAEAAPPAASAPPASAPPAASGAPAPAGAQPSARVAPQAAAPAGPSVFTLPDGAGLVIGQINGGFTCEGKIYGYYADTNNDCKIFHVCVPVLNEQGEATQPPLIFSFFCNNGTIFNQEALVCDYEGNVDCSAAEGFYSVNQEFGKIPDGAQGRSAAAPGASAPPAGPGASAPPAPSAGPGAASPPQPSAGPSAAPSAGPSEEAPTDGAAPA